MRVWVFFSCSVTESMLADIDVVILAKLRIKRGHNKRKTWKKRLEPMHARWQRVGLNFMGGNFSGGEEKNQFWESRGKEESERNRHRRPEIRVCNSSLNERSRSLNLGRVNIGEKLDAYTRVIRKEKTIVGHENWLGMDKKNMMQRWYQDFESDFLGKWCHTRTYFEIDVMISLGSMLNLR